MVLVTVGQHNAAHAVNVLHNVGKIGDHQIHAQHIAVGERHTAVHNEDVALALDERDVLADFVQSAQKGYPDGRLLDGRERSDVHPPAQLASRTLSSLIASAVFGVPVLLRFIVFILVFCTH